MNTAPDTTYGAANVLPILTTSLKIDTRGRVRFTSQHTRFEITKNGIKAYNRDRYGESTAYFSINFLSNATLLLIAEATMLVNG